MTEEDPPNWVELADKCEKAYDHLLLMRAKSGKAKNEDYRQALREFWEVVHTILSELGKGMVVGNIRPTDASGSDTDLSRIGTKMLLVASCIDGFSLGAVSDMIDDARMTGGGRPTLRGERTLIAKALFYLHAVHLGNIRDNSPVKTVADAFGVTKQAVRQWRSKSDTYCDGVAHPHPNLIEEAMRHAGENYKRRGRGGSYKERPHKR